MPKSLYSAPEEFAVSPLLFLLPARSQVSKLKSLYSSLFARHEKVSQQLEESRELERAGAENKSLISEELMLRQVLEWLDSDPVNQQGAL